LAEVYPDLQNKTFFHQPKTEGFKSLEQLHGETKIVSKESTVFRECALDYYLVNENEKVLIVVLTPMATSSEQLELHMSLMSETSLQISVVVRVHPNVWKGVAIKTKFEVDTLVQKMPPSRYNGIVLFPYPVVYNGVSAATVEINNYFSLFVFEKKHKTHAPVLYHVEKIDIEVDHSNDMPSLIKHDVEKKEDLKTKQ